MRGSVRNDLERDIYRAIASECAAMGGEVLALGGVADHVHLLVRMPVAVGIAKFIQQVKGASSHLTTHTLIPDRFFNWQGQYAAFSISSGDLASVITYIKRQKQHHAENSCNPAWEQPSDDV